MDLDTQAALLRLRRELDAASRMAYRNAWVAELSTNASQILDSFEPDLDPHDWARALIRGLPNLALAPGNPWNKKGLERILYDPRLGGSVLVAGIWAVGHFRNRSHGVHNITFAPTSISVETGGGTATVTAIATDQSGNALTLTTPPTWTSQDTSIATVVPTSGGNAVVTGAGSAGQSTVIFATAEGITRQVPVTIIDAPMAATVTAAHDIRFTASHVTVGGAAGTATIGAYATDANGNDLGLTISWTSKDTNVATVSPSTGPSTVVTGVAGSNGQTRFILASAGGITRSVTVTSNAP